MTALPPPVVTAQDLEASTAAALDGFPVTTFREGDKQLPVRGPHANGRAQCAVAAG